MTVSDTPELVIFWGNHATSRTMMWSTLSDTEGDIRKEFGTHLHRNGVAIDIAELCSRVFPRCRFLLQIDEVPGR